MRGWVGPVCIEVTGSGKLANLVRQELFDGEPSDLQTEPELLVDFDEGQEFGSYEPEIFLAKGNFSFNRDAYFAKEPVPHIAQHLFSKDQACRISIRANYQNIFDKALNLGRKAKMLNDPQYTGIMSYALFWHAFHASLLKKSASFVHAGVIANKNLEAIAIVGTGGSGKTSTLFKLLEDEQFSYLSEDFGILSRNGSVYFNPKALSIYASDLRDQRALIEYFGEKMSFGIKLKWLILKNLLGRNPLIKAPVGKIAGARICREAKLKKVFFLIRSHLSQPKIYNASLDEMTHRALNASLRELKWLTESLRLINANAPGDYGYPSEADISHQMSMIYESAFRGVERAVLMIPWKSTPSQTVHFLRERELL